MIPAKYWSPTRKLMLLGAMAGGKAVEDTATGNPLTFLTDLARPLKSLLIPFTPQQEGSGDPSPTNIRNIVPWNGLKVWNGGKNLFDASAVIRRDGYMLNEQGQEITSNTSGYMQNITPVKPSTQYTFSGIVSHNGYLWRIYFFDKNGSLVSRTDAIDGFTDGNTFTFTTPSNCYGISFQYTKAFVDSSTFMLEAGDTATAYEPYKPIADTDIVFPSPVYGGTPDIISGRLLVEYERKAITEFSGVFGAVTNGYAVYYANNKYTHVGNNAGMMKSNLFKYSKNSRQDMPLYSYGGSDGADQTIVFILPDTVTSLAEANTWLSNLETGLEVMLKLVTPQEIQLTPQQITALVGNNTIWSDADGQMVAVYFKKG